MSKRCDKCDKGRGVCYKVIYAKSGGSKVDDRTEGGMVVVQS